MLIIIISFISLPVNILLVPSRDTTTREFCLGFLYSHFLKVYKLWLVDIQHKASSILAHRISTHRWLRKVKNDKVKKEVSFTYSYTSWLYTTLQYDTCNDTSMYRDISSHNMTIDIWNRISIFMIHLHINYKYYKYINKYKQMSAVRLVCTQWLFLFQSQFAMIIDI